jgi:hypothetical protein
MNKVKLIFLCFGVCPQNVNLQSYFQIPKHIGEKKKVINLKLNMCLHQCVSFELDWYGP